MTILLLKLFIFVAASIGFGFLLIKSAIAGGVSPPVNVDMGCTFVGEPFVYDGSSASCGLMPYAGLTGTPTIPASQLQSDWNEANTGVLDYIKNKPTIPTILARVFNNTPSHSIVTTAAAANGFQLSTTRDASVSYSVLITVTASIASGQSGYVVLEIASTNSVTATDWVEIARESNSQVYTLAVAIQGVQGNGTPLTGKVPAGYYCRLRSVNVTGTPAYSYLSGQEVLE